MPWSVLQNVPPESKNEGDKEPVVNLGVEEGEVSFPASEQSLCKVFVIFISMVLLVELTQEMVVLDEVVGAFVDEKENDENRVVLTGQELLEGGDEKENLPE